MVAASSRDAAAARAVAGVDSPNEQSGYLPIILYSAALDKRPDLSAASTISGPIPAQSPRVMPIRLAMRELPHATDGWQLWPLNSGSPRRSDYRRCSFSSLIGMDVGFLP